MQDGLENTALIHQATWSPISKRSCNDRLARNEQSSSEEQPRLAMDSNKDHDANNNFYVAEKTRLLNGYWPHLPYVMRSYGYSTVDDTVDPPTNIPQQFIDVSRRRFDRQRMEKFPLGEVMDHFRRIYSTLLRYFCSWYYLANSQTGPTHTDWQQQTAEMRHFSPFNKARWDYRCLWSSGLNVAMTCTVEALSL